jgi:hypothetical protein
MLPVPHAGKSTSSETGWEGGLDTRGRKCMSNKGHRGQGENSHQAEGSFGLLESVLVWRRTTIGMKGHYDVPDRINHRFLPHSRRFPVSMCLPPSHRKGATRFPFLRRMAESPLDPSVQYQGLLAIVKTASVEGPPQVPPPPRPLCLLPSLTFPSLPLPRIPLKLCHDFLE